jgi:hypothetical protein
MKIRERRMEGREKGRKKHLSEQDPETVDIKTAPDMPDLFIVSV